MVKHPPVFDEGWLTRGIVLQHLRIPDSNSGKMQCSTFVNIFQKQNRTTPNQVVPLLTTLCPNLVDWLKILQSFSKKQKYLKAPRSCFIF